jgi:hemerythrin-like metal-binding protein
MKIHIKLILFTFIVNAIISGAVLTLGNNIAILLLCFAISLVGAYFIGKNISKNTHSIKKELDSLADGRGDLTIKLHANSKDEIGEIALSFNKFLEELEQIIAKVNITSKLVADSSISLSKNLKDIMENPNNENHMKALKDKMEYIADNVNKQTAFSEEAASATTQISQSINSIYERAEKTRNLALDTSRLAKESESNIIKNLKELENIESSVQNIETKTEILETSSKKISDIVELINNISDQTSLLALNASIEAARAGEAGRGFSIVADEVSKLASNSADATGQIEELVKSIQNEIKDLVALTKTGYKQVQAGRQTTELTNTKILDIINKINVTSSEVQEISTSIKEQKQAVEEINVAMDEISNRSVEISNLSNDQLVANESISNVLKETTVQSGKLSEISDALKNVVQNFKVSENIEIKRKNAVEWSEDFSVKISLMDKEHKVLFDLINELNNAMLDGKSSDKISEILDSLIDYTEYHFGDEEKMLEKISYPHLDEQIKSHRAFVNKMKEFKAELESGEILLSVKIINFLKDWLIKHIINIDTKYTGYAHEHGVK